MTDTEVAPILPKPRIFNLANALTLFRFPAAPAMLWLILHMNPVSPNSTAPAWISLAAVGLLFVALLTDLFDGMVARTYKSETNFGRIMDPVADSTLFMTILFALSTSDRFREGFPVWIPILVLYREVGMHVLRRYAALKGIVLAAKISGKAKMAIQSTLIFGLLALVYAHDSERTSLIEAEIQRIAFWCGIIIAGVNLLSVIEYAREIPTLVEEWQE